MENASKALIIAGAILLAISIIGIGMYVYQQAAGAVTGIGFDKEKIETYNSPFEIYEGKKMGSDVRNLCETVKNHNLANVNDESKQITLSVPSKANVKTGTDINDAKKTILSAKQYEVAMEYDDKTGYITSITVTAAK